jgi:flagellar hook-associated protein 1 FlgK
VETMAGQVNSAATQVAGLNEKIRFAVANGGSANELIDQRNQLTTELASLTGAIIRQGSDGQVDVLIGGNALVTGASAHQIKVAVTSARDIADDASVRLEWATRDNSTPVVLDGGEIAGALSILGNGPTDGPLRDAATEYNRFADELALAVNSVHQGGFSSEDIPKTGTDFFGFKPEPGLAKALALFVIPSKVEQLATAKAEDSPLDGSIADALSQLGIGAKSPDRTWEGIVTQIGVSTKTALQESNLATIAAESAISLQLSNASVDLDEENVNLLSYQHAYQGAARVMTAIDEMLDTLINRTGLVGR